MPLPAAVAALLPIAGSGIISGINNMMQNRNSQRAAETSRFNTKMTIDANKELAQYQFDTNKQMWHLQNEYNNPTQQMKRLNSAGLNPHLVYGQGSVVGNTSSQIPQYSAPKVDYNHQPFVEAPLQLGQFMDTIMRAAQVDNVRSNTRKTEAEVLNEAVKNGLLKEQKASALMDNIVKQADLGGQMVRDRYSTAIKQNDLVLHNQAIQQGEEKTRQAKTKTESDNLQLELNKLRYKWEKIGITPQDKIYFRILAKLVPQDMLKKVLGDSLINQLQ